MSGWKTLKGNRPLQKTKCLRTKQVPLREVKVEE